MRVFILFFQLLVFFNPVTSLSQDGWALLHFRSHIEEDPKQALLNWNAYDEHPCSWFGVTCKNGMVTSLNLSGLLLKGTLSPDLGKLVNLRELILRGNCLTGVIPFQLGELGKLEVLDLAHNHFSGQLPEDLGNLSSLSRLYLHNNNLEGTIPAELGELEGLCELIISVNKLTGIIPGGLITETQNVGFQHESILEMGVCKLKYLQVADLSSNYFEGDLPSCLRHLPSAQFSFNCLSREGSSQQRPIEDCTHYSIVGRRHLLADGSAGDGPVSSAGAPTNNQNVFIISSGSSSPSPSTAPVEGALAPAAAPTTFTSPSPSPSVATSSSATSSSSNSSKTIVIATSVPALLVLVGIGIFLCCRHKATAVRPWRGDLQKGFTKGVPAFGRGELEIASEGFSNIIGLSPDIALFKGILTNGVEVAITSIRKSAKSWSSNSELIFWRKVESLSQMKDENLVNLLGYCAEDEPFIRMLVFEYVPNGTVHEHLHNKESEHLDWETRMRIIMRVAYALDYLHHGCDSPVVHTKLDTRSVFLSEDFSAKVADFGVWKISESQKDLKGLSGRSNKLGHDDLELSDRLTPHLETNIYDFGVFLLEMVSGRSPHSKEFEALTDWGLTQHQPWIVDPTLESSNPEELEVVTKMAYKCLQSDASKSLTMREISSSLGSSISCVKKPSVPKSSPLLWAELEILSQD